MHFAVEVRGRNLLECFFDQRTGRRLTSVLHVVCVVMIVRDEHAVLVVTEPIQLHPGVFFAFQEHHLQPGEQIGADFVFRRDIHDGVLDE